MRHMKLGAVGEGAQWNLAPLEKAGSEITRPRRRRRMNGPFSSTSLKYSNYAYSPITQNETNRYRRMHVEALGAFSYGA